ncbi:MAG: hypothetical protein GX591_06515 [Planctomycetes bacterium]|nr:hypothetical protein [Planctomycetota bacterium]
MRPSALPRLRRSGVALIAVMWVILVAGLLLLGLTLRIRATLLMAHNELECVRAHWLARAGVEQALAVLSADAAAADGPGDLWYDDELTFGPTELTGGSFMVTAPPGDEDAPDRPRFGLIDHAGRLNVNEAEAQQLAAVSTLEDWQVAALLDWRDSDTQVSPNGAEGPFYEGLPHPYAIRNGPLRTIDELRLVRGIDQADLAGEDANDNGILDAHENDGAARWPDDNADGRLQAGLARLVTVYAYELNRDADGNERVNVNTVDEQTLIDRFSFSKALARGLVNHSSGSRQGGDRQGGGGQRFGSLMDLLDVKGRREEGDEDADGAVTEITLAWLAANLDALTLTDDERLPARVNVNTASGAVLASLPQINAETAASILRRRASGSGPVLAVGELLTGRVLSEDQFKAVAEKVTVRSNVFEIRSTGVTRWGIRQSIVAIADRGTTPMSILYWYQDE